MSNTPKPLPTRELELYEARLLDAIKLGLDGCEEPSRDTYCKNLVRDLLDKRRLTGGRQIIALMGDMKARKGSRAYARAIGEELIAIADELFEEEPIDLNTAFLEEETAEAEKDIAEARLITERSRPAALALLNASRKYAVKNERLTKSARAFLHGAH